MIERLASIQKNSKQPSTKMSQFWFSQGSKVEVKDNMSRVIITRKKIKKEKEKLITRSLNSTFSFFLAAREQTR